MEGTSVPSVDTSGSSWARGLRPGSALVFEVVRLGLGAFLAITLVFLALRVWTPFPALSLVPRDPKYAGLVQQNIATFALDKPLWTQYFVWMGDVVTGNLGVSFFYRQPVSGLLGRAAAVTLELVVGMILWASVLGCGLGWLAATRRYRAVRGAARGLGTLLYGLPLVWVLLLVFLAALQAFGAGIGAPFGPTAVPPVTGFLTIDAILTGNAGLVWTAFWTTAAATLPGGLVFSLPVLLRVRSGLLRVQGGAAGGLGPRASGLGLRAALVSSLAPLSGALAVLAPFFVGASFLAEWAVARRGLGFLAVQAVDVLDLVVLQAAVVVGALLAIAVALPFAILAGLFLREDGAPRSEDRVVPLAFLGYGAWFRGSLRRALSRRAATFWIGVALVAVPLGMTLLAPALTPYAPFQRVTDHACGAAPSLQPPCAAHPLGTDYFGYDVFAQVVYGGALVLTVAGVALVAAAGISFGLALLSAAFGRGFDVPVRAALGALAAFPVFLLLLMLVLSESPGSSTRTGGLVLVFLPVLFRDARDLAASAKVRAERATTGAPTSADAALEAATAGLIPGFLAVLPRRLAEMILLFEAVAFLGVLPPMALDWSSIMAQGLVSNAFLTNPLWLVVPGLLTFLLVAGLLFLSDGLRGVLTPAREGPEAVGSGREPLAAAPPSAGANP